MGAPKARHTHEVRMICDRRRAVDRNEKNTAKQKPSSASQTEARMRDGCTKCRRSVIAEEGSVNRKAAHQSPFFFSFIRRKERRRKNALAAKLISSAIGKAHHTMFTSPLRLSSQAAGTR